MAKIFSALVGLSMLGLVGAAAAAEPVALTEAQMDAVTAGRVAVQGPFVTVTIAGTLGRLTGLNATFSIATFYVVSAA